MLCKKMKIMKWSTVIRTLVRIFIVVTLKNLFIDKSNLYLKTSVLRCVHIFLWKYLLSDVDWYLCMIKEYKYINIIIAKPCRYLKRHGLRQEPH